MTKETTKPYYQQSTKDVLAEFKTDAKTGLSTKKAQAQLLADGPNALVESKQTTLLQKFFAQFKDLMIIILFIAAIISAMTGETIEAIFIMAIVIMNAVFGVFQEARAEGAINALKEMSTPDANAIRDGHDVQIKATDLVVGDIVRLEAGDVVPADLRLIESNALKIEESALTGESVPVDKKDKVLRKSDLPLGDRDNLGYMNTNVTYGRGIGVVTATGMNTEVGHIANMLEQTAVIDTPLQQDLKKLGEVLTYLILFIAAVVFVVGMIRGLESWQEMLLTAISLAVAAIPEGLPAIVTITLALGTSRMAKSNTLMRRLPAVETLGSTQIIGSDKTGTLTQNKMTVEKYVVGTEIIDAATDVAKNKTAQKLADIMALNNDTKINEDGLVGDPTETALISFNQSQSRDVFELLEKKPRVAEIPFDSERKLMTTVNEDGKKYIITVKGAPDELLKRATQIEIDGNVKKLTPAIKEDLLRVNGELADQALRVLAFAYQTSAKVPAKLDSKSVEKDLIFAGFVAMIDPERPEVAEAVKQARQAGIRPIMITGDHKATASAIAIRLGILDPEDRETSVITGEDLDRLSDAEFAERVKEFSVYARVAPEHKVRIVKAWQNLDQVVAMTGDGVNDAPALKTADIGIAMGITGTEVSKGAADMVLADDNFATIVKAIKEGRKVFTNIQKALQYLLSSNLMEVITLFTMTLLGWNLFTPIMILWINLVTDSFPAIALGVEPAEPGLMNRKPRTKSQGFLSHGVGAAVVWQGILGAVLVLAVYGFGLAFPDHPGNTHLIHGDALTMAFMTLGLMQMFKAFNAKSVYQSIFKIGLFKNHLFNWAILTSTLAIVAVVVIPGLNDLFHVTSLNLHQWSIVFGTSAASLFIIEIVKFIQRRYFGKI